MYGSLRSTSPFAGLDVPSPCYRPPYTSIGRQVCLCAALNHRPPLTVIDIFVECIALRVLCHAITSTTTLPLPASLAAALLSLAESHVVALQCRALVLVVVRSRSAYTAGFHDYFSCRFTAEWYRAAAPDAFRERTVGSIISDII